MVPAMDIRRFDTVASKSTATQLGTSRGSKSRLGAVSPARSSAGLTPRMNRGLLAEEASMIGQGGVSKTSASARHKSRAKVMLSTPRTRAACAW